MVQSMEANIRKRNLVASDHRPTCYDSVLKCSLKWRSRTPDDTRSLETRVVTLTFRLLMSYIYMEHLFLMFLDHTQRRSTVGKTPLDE